MKKILIFLVAAISLVSCSQYDDVALWNKTMNINSRLLTLEELCEQMNTNITSLQTVVNVLQENDYITSVNPVYEGNTIIGYTIDFYKSPSITIYHGQNGKDGANGKDGKDGAGGEYVPQIGIKQDADGHYYWTLEGSWLLDENGQRILAEGLPGKDGQNGTDGKDGKDGIDGINGKDGITPKFKIENGDWYVSTDNGQTWENIGRATGENGKDGKDGFVGDSMFSNIDTSNSEYVIFTLVDGTVIKIPTWHAFEELMKLCNEMNTNITSLQKIVEALQENDYITGVTPLLENGAQIGYTITFKKSGPIVIYHGKDGADGNDGKDGYSPKIGVTKDADGIYYWTLDGEWLLDDNGKKIKAEGKDGKDGNGGSSGEAGSGKDGEDGITPELKIEDGYWYVSYDNGETWRKLGKATGENGKDGQPGENGDSFFKNVDASSSDYIIFVLVDGTEIKIPTWYAFEELKKFCNELNTNIQSIKTIIEAMEAGDYIVSCTPLMENGKQIGYTITFAKGGSIVIYHGKDGQDGTDGTSGSNGENGHTPLIGVKEDVDGIFYWTVDGEWLTDESGAKIPVTGKDGQTGSKGEDGITPQLKIEDGYWYVSYDGGQQWQKLGKATGEDGKDSEGIKITEDEYNVYFDLPDGTRITISKSGHNPSDIIHFDDINVKKICVQNWDTNHDGELSYAEAAAVKSIGTVFSRNKDIQLFNEFKYFINVTELEEQAFESCSNLWYLSLPSYISKIGDHALSNCSSLFELQLPGSLTEIGDNSFSNIGSKSIIIPKAVKKIGEYAFQYAKCETIEFEKNSELEEIGQSAFQSSKIVEICIPAGVTTIQLQTFYLCHNLQKVTFEEGSQLNEIQTYNPKIPTYYGFQCESLVEFDASNCVHLTQLPPYLFSASSTSNVAPIATIKIGANNPPSCSSNTFQKSIYNATLYVPKESIELYKNDSRWKDFKNIVALEEI